VWVGNFDRSPLRGSSGVTGAGPIFHAVMLAAQRRAGGGGDAFADAALADPPEGLDERELCALSGMPANPWCPAKRREHVPAGSDPAPCSWHHQSDEGLITEWPPEYREWARSAGLAAPKTTGAATIAVRHVTSTSDSRPVLSIASPPSGATYLIDPTLRREFQTLPLRAVTRQPGRLEWHVDGHRLGVSSSESPLAWPLTPGTHDIEVRDTLGRTASTRVTVK